MTEHLERIWPTVSTLPAFFKDFPDHEQRYQFAIPYVQDKAIADIACGAGYGSNMLSRHAKSVKGFDIDAPTLAHATQHFSTANCSFHQAAELGINAYDVITSFETLEHMSEADGDMFLQSLHKALKKGGTLILSTPMNEGANKHNVTPFHIREYSHAELVAKLKNNGFNQQNWWGQSNQATRAMVGQGGINIQGALHTGLQKYIPICLGKTHSRLCDLLKISSIFIPKYWAVASKIVSTVIAACAPALIK